MENSGGYLKISAEISVNHVQFCRPELENLCEEYLKPAVVVSTGEDSSFFMRWEGCFLERKYILVLLVLYLQSLM